jgi:actin-related protein
LKPLYQVRNDKLPERRDIFHRLALLNIARESRESGAGQSINTAASKSLQVPSISFTLPDGQTVDIPSVDRFAVADLAVGQKVGSSENDKILTSREKALEKMQDEYQSIIISASEEENDEEDDDDDDMSVDEGEKQRQAKQYTEASAVGVASRRTTRATRGAKATAIKKVTPKKGMAPSPKKPVSDKVRFHNCILQNACTSYLQSLSDQLTATPIASMVCDAAFQCDRDQQASVLGNVVLSGGGACIGPTDQAVPDLLREQMEVIIHAHTPGWRVKVLSPGMQERAICSWLGASILGSLGTFHNMWITKEEYEEWGSAIVNRKCP